MVAPNYIPSHQALSQRSHVVNKHRGAVALLPQAFLDDALFGTLLFQRTAEQSDQDTVKLRVLPPPSKYSIQKIEKRAQETLLKQAIFDRSAVSELTDVQVAKVLLRICKASSSKDLKECTRMMSLSDTREEIQEQIKEFQSCQEKVRRFVPRILKVINESVTASQEERREIIASLDEIMRQNTTNINKFYQQTMETQVELSAKKYHSALTNFIGKHEIFQRFAIGKDLVAKWSAEIVTNPETADSKKLKIDEMLKYVVATNKCDPGILQLVNDFYRHLDLAKYKFSMKALVQSDLYEHEQKLPEITRGIEGLSFLVASELEKVKGNNSQVLEVEFAQPRKTSLWTKAKSFFATCVADVKSAANFAIGVASDLLQVNTENNFWLKALANDELIRSRAILEYRNENAALVRVPLSDGEILVQGNPLEWITKVKIKSVYGEPSFEATYLNQSPYLDLAEFVSSILSLHDLGIKTSIPRRIKASAYDYIDLVLKAL
jgi:hypothetical protein